MENINTTTMLPMGTVLNGRYHIVRYLSSGGFGNTYEATNEFGERVAIKEFFMRGINQRDHGKTSVSVSNSENHNQFSQQREKFKKEALRIRGLQSPHIVKVLSFFEENGTSYYAMNYIDGESLSQRLERLKGKALSEAEVRSILDQMLDALDEVHKAGLYHLDIKPGNIMVDHSGMAHLIDFGASKQMDANTGGATAHTEAAFTKGYAPIEQIEGSSDRIGPWTDLYALGATLYRLITAQSPPSHSDISDLGEGAFHFLANASKEMRSLILWMMSPQRSKRPQTVAELRSVLKPKVPSIPSIVDNDVTIVQPIKPKVNSQEPPNSLSGIVENSVVSLYGQKRFTVNGVSFTMIEVEGGTFTMGNTNKPDHTPPNDEKPTHRVKLSSFYIGRTVVTQELWQAVMGNNPNKFKGNLLPVETVSWDDCQKFICKLNAITGEHFHLPTEAQWEFAARGGIKSHGYKYAGSNNLEDVAWFNDNSGGAMHKVSTKLANELGIYDMSGNVYEWCEDWYAWYSSESQINPTGPSTGSFRVTRGGSRFSYAKYCRVSYRNRYTPNTRNLSIGFRLVL